MPGEAVYWYPVTPYHQSIILGTWMKDPMENLWVKGDANQGLICGVV